MAQGFGSREFYLDEITRKLKEDPNPPATRAQAVLDHLLMNGGDVFTNYDVLCFAAEYIGMQAVQMEWLKPSASALLRLLYITHVARFGDVAWMDQKTLGSESEKMESDTTTGP